MRRILAATLVAAALANAASAQLVWELRKPMRSPPAIDHSQLVYEPARQQCLTLVVGPTHYTTWIWDGTDWAASKAASPPVAPRHRLVHDTKRDRTVFIPEASANTLTVWEWDGSQWIDTKQPGSGLLYRSVAFDASRNKIVSLGGISDRTYLAFEAWDGTSWKTHPVQPPPTMAARCAAAMTFDTDRNVLVLFGGYDGFAALHDTWELSGSTWTRRFPTSNATGVWGHSMTYDPVRRRTFIYGGIQDGRYNEQLWEWDGTTWTHVFGPLTPDMRAYHGTAYDTVRRRLVLFGGLMQGIASNQTWELYDQRTPADYRGFGSGCAGTNGTPSIAAPLGMFPRIGFPFRADVTNLPPGRFTTLLVGASKSQWGSLPLPLDLTPVGMPGCTAYCSDEWAFPLVNLNGTASWNVTVPNLAGLAGLRFYNQVYVSDPPTNQLGLISSNAAEGLIGY